MIQPRRTGARGGDSRSPDPAFSPAQYDRLALLYTIASVRAGRWLIPAFHAALDAEYPQWPRRSAEFRYRKFCAKPRPVRPITASPGTDCRGLARRADGGRVGRPPAIPTPFAVTAVDDPPPAAAHDAAAADRCASPMPQRRPQQQKPARRPSQRHGMLRWLRQESEFHSAQQSRSAPKHCKTHIVKGHRRRLCEPDRADACANAASACRSISGSPRFAPKPWRAASRRIRTRASCAGFSPDTTGLEAIHNQPEFNEKLWQYLNRARLRLAHHRRQGKSEAIRAAVLPHRKGFWRRARLHARRLGHRVRRSAIRSWRKTICGRSFRRWRRWPGPSRAGAPIGSRNSSMR